jgi:hypothetical protein
VWRRRRNKQRRKVRTIRKRSRSMKKRMAMRRGQKDGG